MPRSISRRQLIRGVALSPAVASPAAAAEDAQAAADAARGSGRPVDFVDTLIGTAPPDDKEYLGNNPPKGEELYSGSVVPGAMALDGVVKLGPDTGFDGIFHVRGPSYRYTDASIMGFSHTHHEYNRYANILFMPVVGPVKTKPGSRENPDDGYRSPKDAQQERGAAGYYTVFLTDYRVRVELTATRNAGFHRYTFPKSSESRILIDLASAANSNPVSEAKVEALDNRRVEGWQKCRGFTVYFCAAFSKPFSSFGTWNGGALQPASTAQTGRAIGAYADYSTGENESILVKVGISFVDAETARKSLAEEIPGWDFDEIRRQAQAGWNRILERIKIEGGTEGERINFYTSLYRALASENFGWPNGGAVQTVIRREWVVDKLKSMKWTTTRGGFWGPQLASWVAGASARGIRDFDAAAAYDALRHSAVTPSVGWERLSDYLRLGYIPSNDSVDKPTSDSAPGARPDTVNRTLGYAYEDYCIAQLAKALGRESDYEYFLARSSNFRLLFDPLTGFMRARRPDGSWVTPFDPAMPFGQRFYREGTAWHYLWLVPHDVEALIGLLGGRAAFIKKLDEFFTSKYDPPEPMRDLTGMIGQYTHGNEHDRQVPYYYNYAGAPWKSQEIVRRIMRVLHKPTPAGLCGMDDNGYLTGWYVFSALGFYPVEPALGCYVIGSPIFRKATLQVQGPGRPAASFVIEARNSSDENIYIQSATLNGAPLNKPWFHHSDLVANGSLVFEMGPKPNKQWGGSPQAAPQSVTPVLVAAAPTAVNRTFAAAPPAAVPARLVDPQASAEARDLMARLTADYGKRSWAALKLSDDIPLIETATGERPVIISGDFMNYSPSRLSHGTDPKDHTEKMIGLRKNGHVNAMDWHWNAPSKLVETAARRWTSGFMADASTFDVACALANVDSADYAALIRDMDAVAAQLRKFSDAGIPVLWRPLHEADGGWFWWGAKGVTAFVQLWRLLFTRLTVHHGLHNLIWVYTPANPSNVGWYPGADVVDIIGLDAYPKEPGDTLASKWRELQASYGARKMFALTEFGGVPDIEAMQREGVWWAYFSSWNRTLEKSPREILVRTYRSPNVRTMSRPK